MFQHHSDNSGFTLIELLIVVAIVGILLAIAVPSYSQFMLQGRRSDAISFLNEVAGEQVQYFSDNNQYAESMSELGYGSADTFGSPEGHYVVSVSQPSGGPNTFLLTATPAADGAQAGDSECLAFTIRDTGAKANTGDNDDCW